MKKLFAVFLLAACALMLAQAAVGTVTFTPPQPGKLVVTAGSETCTLTGNNVPATALSIACTIGSTTIPAYTMPLIAGASFTFQFNLNGDALTVILTADSTGKISYDAAATPNGGTTAHGTGNF
ncbi:MAG: hypothetical protein ABSH08_22250 [Tepidisphaeraceae bacterium]|jgi:hypothetical protein